MIIAVSGVARCGKSSFCKFFQEFLDSQGVDSQIFAFADQLKLETEQFIFDKYDLDVWSEVTEEKNVFRDLLVAHGRIQRNRTNGTYWVEQVAREIEKMDSQIALIADCRYPNECAFIQDREGIVIHITRLKNGEPYPPANSEEAENDPLVKEKSDRQFVWEDFGDDENKGREQVIEFIKTI